MNKVHIGLITISLLIAGIFYPATHYALIMFLIVILIDTHIKYGKKLKEKSFEEVSRYRKLESNYIQIKQHLDIAIKHFPNPILIVDGKGKVILFNEKMNPFSISKLEETAYDKIKLIMELQLLLEEGFERQVSKEIVFENQKRFYQAFLHSIPLENSKLTGCILFLNDITNTVKKERFQQEFIQNASHELKTPISVLKAMNEIVLREDIDKENQIQFLKDMQDEVCKLEKLTKQLLQISKNHYDLNIVNQSIIPVIQQAYQNGKSYQKNIGFEMIIEHEFFDFDYEKMVIILTNLLTNAFHYSETGTVKITAKKDCVEVSDEGIGIDEKEYPKIFERFYRVDKARNTNLGTGLGLSIVKTLVELHGYRIDVNKNIPYGSKFTIYFKK